MTYKLTLLLSAFLLLAAFLYCSSFADNNGLLLFGTLSLMTMMNAIIYFLVRRLLINFRLKSKWSTSKG